MTDRRWVHEAIERIEADFARSADTHLIRVELPAQPGIDLYLKDESTHPTGSLKHRLARSLILYGLCNGWIGEGTTLVESSSGSTAVSEAYFARLLGLPFVAVMPRTTSRDKVAKIEFQGGRCAFVDDPREVYASSPARSRPASRRMRACARRWWSCATRRSVGSSSAMSPATDRSSPASSEVISRAAFPTTWCRPRSSCSTGCP